MLKLLVLTIIVWVIVRFIENRSIFFPTPEISSNPSALGLGYEDIYFKTPDGFTLNGWLIKNPQSMATLLYLHGNAGNISHRLEKIAMFYPLGLNIFIIDYRGYGRSQGQPSEEGIYQDAVAAFDYLASRGDMDKNKIVAYGDSLGGVAAIDLATRRSVAALIVDSTFSSAADISRSIYFFIPTIFLKTKMDSISKVKQLKLPKLFMHSVDDEIIPFKLGRRLFDAAAQPKEFIQLRGGHNINHLGSNGQFLDGIRVFLKKLGL